MNNTLYLVSVSISVFIIYAITLWFVWIYRKKIITILKKIHKRKAPNQLYNLGENKKGTDVVLALNDYSPDVVFYFSAASSNFLLHVKMWLPYLTKTNLKIYIMVREHKHVKSLLEMTQVPICFANSLRDMEAFLPDSVKLAFYANNGTKNTHIIRFNHIKHIQLLHGDSEKPPSYNPVSKMYDKLYVSGKRAIDRYAENNVHIDQKIFEIVGRPQLSEVKVGKQENGQIKTVLISPTWGGYFEDTNFSSLLRILEIVEYLFSREENIRVIIRLHPSTNRKNKEIATYLKRLELLLVERKDGSFFSYGRDIVEDFNMSDCLVADISSVPIDYLYTEKPIVHLDIKNIFSNPKESTFSKYISSVYVIDENLKNINNIFDDIFYTDSLEELRKDTKYYYHGKFKESLVDKFTQTVLTDFKTKKY